jgi:hypothetical protein
MASPEEFAKFLERYLAEVPGGDEGDREMRRRITVPFMDTTDADVRRDEITDAEIDGWFTYLGWNLWELIANRSTEGESGLIPRQEYETIAFVQQWAKYPELMRELTEILGVDGVIALGATPRREVSTQLNTTRNWAAPVCPLLGRGIATSLGLEAPSERRADVETVIQFGRRLQHGTWGGGCGFVSGRGFSQAMLEDDLVRGFLAAETSLDDPEVRKTFLRFNATTELFGFLMSYDCRAALCDSGPYPVPGGGFMIVRDHQLQEPAFPWGHLGDGLPYSVTEALVFRPSEPVDVKINDISTTFTTPRDYLKHLSGVAVYARDTWDTPMSELRRLDPDELAAITARASAATLGLYKDIAAKDRDQKIRDGVLVYTTTMIMPYARVAGVWDRWVAEGFYDFDPLTEAAYPTLAGGKAAEVLAPVFLLGQGFPSVADVVAV